MFDSYITKEWYRDEYPCTNKFQAGDTPTDEENIALDRAISKACRVIDKVTFRRATCFSDLADDGITYLMTDDERESIMWAVGAQIDYIASLGYSPLSMSGADYGNGFSIGKYSESADKEDARARDEVSQGALEYLRVAGLTKNGFRGRPGTMR